jgi:hypothetical protein
MRLLLLIFGWPHEALHVLALWLIGRRPEAVTRTHVDIPADLTTGQYVFVAGLPALVFWSAAALCAQALFNAPDVLRGALALAALLVFSLGGFSTVGDLLLIARRLLDERTPPRTP